MESIDAYPLVLDCRARRSSPRPRLRSISRAISTSATCRSRHGNILSRLRIRRRRNWPAGCICRKGRAQDRGLFGDRQCGRVLTFTTLEQRGRACVLGARRLSTSPATDGHHERLGRLAFVVGHETAHIAANHAPGAQIGRHTIAIWGVLGLSFVRSSGSNAFGRLISQCALRFSKWLLSFSRNQDIRPTAWHPLHDGGGL